MRNYECYKLDILNATNLMRPLVKLQLDAALLYCSIINMVDLKILFSQRLDISINWSTCPLVQ